MWITASLHLRMASKATMVDCHSAVSFVEVFAVNLVRHEKLTQKTLSKHTSSETYRPDIVARHTLDIRFGPTETDRGDINLSTERLVYRLYERDISGGSLPTIYIPWYIACRSIGLDFAS